MKLLERIESYRKAFPKMPCTLYELNGRIEGVWFLGNDYSNKSRLYGAYPGSYLKRIISLFPEKKDIMHLFSGSIPKGHYVRVDSNLKNNPDVVCDAECLHSGLKPRLYPWGTGVGKFDVVYADPPYSQEDCEHYGTPMIRRNKVIESVRRVLGKGGHLIWLDQVLPQYSKEKWKLMLAIGIVISTNHRTRFVFGFEKQ